MHTTTAFDNDCDELPCQVACISSRPLILDAQLLAAAGLSENQLHELREFLEPRWIAWGSARGKAVSARGNGMCRFTSAFLVKVLGRGWRFSGGFSDHWNAVEGWVPNPAGGGYWTGTGWESHHWATKGRVLLDLTASQFGAEDIVVTTVSDPRYRANMLAFQVEEAVRDVRERASVWHQEWIARSLWTAAGEGTTG